MAVKRGRSLWSSGTVGLQGSTDEENHHDDHGQDGAPGLGWSGLFGARTFSYYSEGHLRLYSWSPASRTRQ